MKHKTWTIAACAALLAWPYVAYSKSVTVQVAGQSLSSGTTDRGAYYVLNLPVPEDVIGKRLDTVLLEFYVDVEADETIKFDYAPSIEVFPLTETSQLGRSPQFTTAHPTSRPVALGDGQRVLLDITDIVKGWIESPSTNHGLVIGAFSGPKAGALNVRNDVIGSGKALQATFFYQNRFGQRVSRQQ
jgi:hypothetical protein